ncbi:MAG: hypothetical protein HDR80_01640 [Bacteroides sp.]|nr:hypothetical protein [Bacteroides sp.]
MDERPALDRSLDSKAFRECYFLKEELVKFCKDNGIPATGGKIELTGRIAHFLETGRIMTSPMKARKSTPAYAISEDMGIEADFVCSERHRAFFRQHIGSSFTFNVAFQKWLKENAGKTYKEAIHAYRRMLEDKKRTKTVIGRQFEYNAYVRDFFSDNRGMSLADAIRCWKYKKSQSGNHRYERSDLIALKEISS